MTNKPNLDDFFHNRPDKCIAIQAYQHWQENNSRLIMHMAGRFVMPSFGVDFKMPINISIEMYSDGKITAYFSQDGHKHYISVDATHVKYLYDEDFINK